MLYGVARPRGRTEHCRSGPGGVRHPEAWEMKWSAFAALFGVLAFSAPAAAVICSINPLALNFGSYDFTSSIPLDTAGSITFSCDGPATTSISLSKGNSSTYDRFMMNGTLQLPYNLF